MIRAIAGYALRDMWAPLGVTTYRLTGALPDTLGGSLPTIDELEGTLQSLADEDGAEA